MFIASINEITLSCHKASIKWVSFVITLIAGYRSRYARIINCCSCFLILFLARVFCDPLYEQPAKVRCCSDFYTCFSCGYRILVTYNKLDIRCVIPTDDYDYLMILMYAFHRVSFFILIAKYLAKVTLSVCQLRFHDWDARAILLRFDGR